LSDITDFVRRHLRFGWWSLLLFLGLGFVLELLHAFKIGWYVDVSSHTRRLMWTLAHAHGTLLAILHIVFALTLRTMADRQASRWLRVASACLVGASVLLPGGFFLGGVVIYAGDPGVGIALAPLGAILIFVAVLLTALNVGSAKRP
jgi:hypothetical protein